MAHILIVEDEDRGTGWDDTRIEQIYMDTKNIRNIRDLHDEYVILPGDALDPFTDEHNIEYWLWDGERLLPASTEESERFRKHEALLRLGYWKTQREGNDLAQHTPWNGIVIAVQSMFDRLLAYISHISRRTS